LPAEGIHLSALDDARSVLDPEIARLLGVYRDYARLGAILVDLPYLNNFELEMVRFAVGAPPQRSVWGDRFHRQAPAGLGLALLEEARRHKDAGLAALALGHLSHVAIDWELHPLVNELAFARLRARGLEASSIDDPLHMKQHRDVEKFQSVLFHERRLGRDVMGNVAIVRLIEVATTRFFADATLQARLERAFRNALGQAPSAREWMRWGAGYRRYTYVLSTPLGLVPAPEAAKLRERAGVYEDVRFEARYEQALERVRRYLNAGFAAFESGRFDESFFATVTEGSIDDGAIANSTQ
jgi:hypothetical protein